MKQRAQTYFAAALKRFSIDFAFHSHPFFA
jgi:hypothetical protein